MIIDLSHPIYPGMPLYPGTPEPEITPLATVEVEGWMESRINLTTHVGTHMDAPAHKFAGAPTLDRLPVDHFAGPAVVVDVSALKGENVGIGHLEPYAETLKKSEFLLLRSGWSRHWGTEAYFEGYPVLTEEAARWAAEFSLKGVGIDMISVDTMHCTVLPVHSIFLKRGMVVIENLTNLDRLPAGGFTFCCFPLPLRNVDGSPVRAVAMR